jgi:hypothetical protein
MKEVFRDPAANAGDSADRQRRVTKLIVKACGRLQEAVAAIDIEALQENLAEALTASADAEQWCDESEIEMQEKHTRKISRLLQVVEAIQTCLDTLEVTEP